jgi:hypothetical protein
VVPAAADTETPPQPTPYPPLEDVPGGSTAEPPLTDQERQDAEAFLSALPQDQLTDFLRHRDLIGPEEDFYSLSRDYVRRILANPEAFKEAVGFIGC